MKHIEYVQAFVHKYIPSHLLFSANVSLFLRVDIVQYKMFLCVGLHFLQKLAFSSALSRGGESLTGNDQL